MQIDPGTIFTSSEFTGARRLNRILSLLPRYHPHRRWNARAINSLLRLSQILPSHRHLSGEVSIATDVIGSGDASVPLRRLRPKAEAAAIYLHFHGGAWVLGNARLDDGFNLDIIRECGSEIAAVDFHQAVDDRLDLAVAQARLAVESVLREAAGKGRSVIIGGESSGAQLASYALLSLTPAERRPLIGFVSFCGAFEMRASQSLRAAGRDSLLIDAPSARANLERLGASAYSPLAEPLPALPPALFIAGGLDPIRDDSRLFYEAWRARNGNASLLLVPEGPHGFDRFPTRLAATTRRFARRWMRERLATDAT